MRVLSNMLKEDRRKLENRRENINKMLNPQKFIKYKNELEEKYKYIQYIETTSVEKKIIAELLELQKIFLDSYKIKIENTNDKEEILELITEFRYYLNIPIKKDTRVNQLSQISCKINDIIKILIDKAINVKLIINISEDNNVNHLILSEIFTSKIMNIESINIEIIKEKERIFLQIYDENVFDEKIDLGKIESFDVKKFNIKFNKIIKIFNA